METSIIKDKFFCNGIYLIVATKHSKVSLSIKI